MGARKEASAHVLCFFVVLIWSDDLRLSRGLCCTHHGGRTTTAFQTQHFPLSTAQRRHQTFGVYTSRPLAIQGLRGVLLLAHLQFLEKLVFRELLRVEPLLLLQLHALLAEIVFYILGHPNEKEFDAGVV